MTMATADVHEPKFSSGRHKPHSRLNDWHSIDYDEEIFTELAYCMKTLNNTSIISAAADIILEDFSSLKNRCGSTSTPFVPRVSIASSSTDGIKKKPLPSVSEISLCNKSKLSSVPIEDSGFNEQESGILDTFSESCKIVTPSTGDGGYGHDKCTQLQLASDCEIFTHPLPCRSLVFDSEDEVEKEMDCDFENNSPGGNLSEASSSHLDSLDSGYNSQASALSASVSSKCSFSYVQSNVLSSFQSASMERSSSKSTKQLKLLKKMLADISPYSPEVLIGPKVGLPKLDIVSTLHKRNITPALAKLFHYLNDKDLLTCTEVSRAWKLAVLSDVKAKQRRSKHLKTKLQPINKENTLRRSPRKHKERGVTGVKEGPFCSLQLKAVTSTKSPCKDPNGRLPLTRHQLFVQAASALQNDQSLRMCPFCNSPAKVDEVQERAVCGNKRCAYDYCIKCRKPFHGAKPCIATLNKKAKTEGSVGSKKSKRNLKRL